jgi:hypothetical protein
MKYDDPFDDPRWVEAGMLAGAPPRPSKGYVTCSLSWLARVRPLVHTADQMLVLLVLYRQRLICRSRTVALPNAHLAALGIDRRTKYRVLAKLQDAGVITIERKNGHAAHMTLHWFP